MACPPVFWLWPRLWSGRHAQTRLARRALPGFDLAQFRTLAHLRLGRHRSCSVTIITDPLFYALALPAVVALGLSKGGFAGMGQMATPLLALVMPPLEAAAIMLPIMIVQDATAVWVYRKDWNGRVSPSSFPARCIGIGVAWALAAHISEAVVRVFIGVITIAFVLYSWIGAAAHRRARLPQARRRRRRVLGRAVGLYLDHLPGRRAALPDLRARRCKLPKMVLCRHQRIFFASMNWLKVVPYVALGQFSGQGLGTSLVLLPLAIAANVLGFWLVRRDAAGYFLQDHAGRDVSDLDRAGAQRDDRRFCAADKFPARLRLPVCA